MDRRQSLVTAFAHGAIGKIHAIACRWKQSVLGNGLSDIDPISYVPIKSTNDPSIADHHVDSSSIQQQIPGDLSRLFTITGIRLSHRKKARAQQVTGTLKGADGVTLQVINSPQANMIALQAHRHVVILDEDPR
jgi:hypothetical protein